MNESFPSGDSEDKPPFYRDMVERQNWILRLMAMDIAIELAVSESMQPGEVIDFPTEDPGPTDQAA